MEELTIYTPAGAFGHGMAEESVERALSRYDIDYIIVDGGSIDPGPNYLGDGEWGPENLLRHDFEVILAARERHDVPLIISTCGIAGSRAHLDPVATIAREVAGRLESGIDIAKIYADIAGEQLKRYVEDGRVDPAPVGESLSTDDVDRTERIVAQLGAEPYVEALDRGTDLILGGRSVDVAPYAAVGAYHGFDPGLAVHLGKILECGPMAADWDSEADSILGVLGDGYAEVEPPEPTGRCSTESVAAHTLYEKADPYTIQTPTGTADVSTADFTQVSDSRVRIEGTEYRETPVVNHLLEGVERVGYRSIMLCGIRGPEILARLDEILDRTRKKVTALADGTSWTLTFRRYGIDGVPLFPEPTPETVPPEVGLVVDVTAETRERAGNVCGTVNNVLRHLNFEGKLATSGNLAIPYSPAVTDVGPVYEFSVYNFLEGLSSRELANIEYEVVE
ncbi:acyclic terpene utilization AtuA family protein [Halobellus sp. GM3]|uniref:acyclic terpene utilization AtuA family protein n=1 Tax=Halobellus sp. GM3 TaxID=3458410 RepID=UPI00403DD014